MGSKLLGFQTEERQTLQNNVALTEKLLKFIDTFQRTGLTRESLQFFEVPEEEIARIFNSLNPEALAEGAINQYIAPIFQELGVLPERFLQILSRGLYFGGTLSDVYKDIRESTQVALTQNLEEQQSKLAIASQFTIDQVLNNLNDINDIFRLLGQQLTETELVQALPKFANGASNLEDDTLGMFNKNEIVVPSTFSEGIRQGKLALVNRNDLASNGENVTIHNSNTININGSNKEQSRS